MRHRLILCIAVASAFATSAILATAARAAEKVSVDQIPQDVLDRVKTTQPGSKIIGAEKISEHAYNIELEQNGKTSHVSIGGGIPLTQTFEGDNVPEFYKSMFPNSKIIRVIIDNSGFQGAAYIDLLDLQDHDRHVRVAMGLGGGRAGGIWTITKDLATSELPDAVRKAIDEKYPAARIDTASKELGASGVLNSYDVTFHPASDKPRGISCSSTGEIYRDYEMKPQYLAPATTQATQPAR